MKTQNFIKKTALSLFVLIGMASFNSFAQQNGEMKIKIVQDCNGNVTLKDTTFNISDDVNIDSLLQSFEIEIPECTADGNKELKKIVVKSMVTTDDNKLENIFIQMGDEAELENLINSDIIVNESVDKKTKTITVSINSDEDIDKTMTITVDDDGNIKTSEGNISKEIINDENGSNVIKYVVKSDEIVVDGDNEVITNEIFINDEGSTINLENQNVQVFIEKGDDNSVKTKIMILNLSTEDENNLKDIGLSSDENLIVEELKMFPNPNNGKFHLKFNLPNKANTNIRVFDTNGKEVYSETLKKFSGEYDKDIDISKNGKGIYFINVSQEDNQYSKKIIIE